VEKEKKKESAMKEIWQDIKRYEGEYQVSNLGNVRSLKREEKKMLKKVEARNGHNAYYELYKNGMRKRISEYKIKNMFVDIKTALWKIYVPFPSEQNTAWVNYKVIFFKKNKFSQMFTVSYNSAKDSFAKSKESLKLAGINPVAFEEILKLIRESF
jgi:hypothetical protein